MSRHECAGLLNPGHGEQRGAGGSYKRTPGGCMEFPTFYSYFLYTKNWAYILMFIVLPVYVAYWNLVLYKGKKNRKDRH